MTSEALVKLLESRRLQCTTEAVMQAAIEKLFTERQVDFRREEPLSRGDRPDFMVGAVAIECKIEGSLNNVTRQLARYAAHERVTDVLLVTSRVQLTKQPLTLNAKPIRVAYVGGLF